MLLHVQKCKTLVGPAATLHRMKHVRDPLHNLRNYLGSSLNSSFQTKVLAIRREDQSVWERRAPFNPSHVKKLIKRGVKVIVQPSNRRAYPMQVKINGQTMCGQVFRRFTDRRMHSCKSGLSGGENFYSNIAIKFIR